MTTQDAVPDPAQDFLPPVVRPEPDTRLDQLVAEYTEIKPLADEYTARLKTLTDAIKLELRTQHPTRTEILLVGTVTPAPLRLCAVTKWQLDTKTLKDKEPETYARFAKQVTIWPLTQVKS